jgi:hypothetical protein
MPAISEPKYERFCNEYHVDCNRVEAVIRCGCWYHRIQNAKPEPLDRTKPAHRVTASTIASRLMLKPEIIIRINELEKARNQYVRLNAARIVERFQHVAFDYQPDEGPGWKEIIAAAKELAKMDGTLYSENNKQRADAVGEMFKSIFSTKDDLPKNGRTEPTTPDSTETCG